MVLNGVYMKKRKMPKTRADFDRALINAFLAGCTHGYGVEHTVNIYEQEMLGAEHWIGKVPDEEFYERWEELKME